METELKFQVPAAQRAAARAAVATASARTVRLQARYFDTADGRLAAAGLALRLRNEGGGWVQALKGRGDGLLRRVEHEVALPAARAAPTLELSRHDGSAAAAALRRALAGEPPLVEVFATDIRRTLRRVRSGGASIEIALDVGWLKSGRRRLAVHEIEFELVAGAPQALAPLAARWVRRLGLWWDVRTKAERGQRLAQSVRAVPAVSAIDAVSAPLGGDDLQGEAFARMVEGCLAHALPNLAEIADGRGAPDHLHQARVALRRLRAVLRECAAWSGDEAAALALESDWRTPFAQLGAARDLDVMISQVLPRLRALGLPMAPPPMRAPSAGAAGASDPQRVVVGAEMQMLLLRTLALAQAARAAPVPRTRRAVHALQGTPALQPIQAAGAGAAPGRPLRPLARAVLQRAWRRALAGRKNFRCLSTEEQHRARKRLKRLRYLSGLLGPLFGRGRAASQLSSAMGRAADALGELNDLVVAREALAQALPAAAQPLLNGEQQRLARRAERALVALGRLPPPWRR